MTEPDVADRFTIERPFAEDVAAVEALKWLRRRSSTRSRLIGNLTTTASLRH